MEEHQRRDGTKEALTRYMSRILYSRMSWLAWSGKNLALLLLVIVGMLEGWGVLYQLGLFGAPEEPPLAVFVAGPLFSLVLMFPWLMMGGVAYLLLMALLPPSWPQRSRRVVALAVSPALPAPLWIDSLRRFSSLDVDILVFGAGLMLLYGWLVRLPRRGWHAP